MKICLPTIIKDIIIMVIFPPLWVLLKEAYSPIPFGNFVRVIFNVILTSMFYFPGLIHAMIILRTDGPI